MQGLRGFYFCHCEHGNAVRGNPMHPFRVILKSTERDEESVGFGKYSKSDRERLPRSLARPRNDRKGRTPDESEWQEASPCPTESVW